MFNLSNKSGQNILVLDAIMGNGKTQRIKQIILESEQPVIYITPLLEEAHSVVGAIVDDTGRHVRDDSGYYMYDNDHILASKCFMLPNNRNSSGSKLEHIKQLISERQNIASTHQLFSILDQEVVMLLHASDYELIVDEALNVWHNLNIYEGLSDDSKDIKKFVEDEKQERGSGSMTDREVQNLIKNGIIEVDPLGLLHWQSDKFEVDDGLFLSRVKRLCDLKQLYLSNGRVVFWELNSVILSCFSNIVIGTYMFEHNFMSHYLDVHGFDYTVEKFGNKPSFYKDLINIENGKLNQIGEKDYSLSYNDLCVKKHVDNHPKDVLRKNLDNFLKHKCKSKTGERIWTCFKKVTPTISNQRYTNDWVAYNIKATNNYRHIEHVAYLCNNFPNTFLVAMVTKRNSREFNDDLWALQEMLQYIWRSRIRGNEDVESLEDRKINLYVPSKRMRTLLEQWLNEEFEN